jgi:transcriptional regulator with XRE-family HTH domain
MPKQLTDDALEDREKIAANLIKFREENRLSQEQAALAADVKLDTLRKYEQAKRSVQVTVLKRLCDLYGHAIDHVLMTNPPPADPAQRKLVWFKILAGDNVEIPESIKEKARSFEEQLNRELMEALRARKRKARS